MGLVREWLTGRQFALTFVAIALFVYFSVAGTRFFTLDNIYDMARLSTFMLIVGVPLTFLFVAKEIDISIGSAYGLTTVVMGKAIVDWGLDPWAAAGIAVATGALIGLVNGFAVAVVGVPSLIFTLGMFSLLRGLGYVLTAGQPINYPFDLESSFFTVASGDVGGFPVQAFWAAGIVVLGAVVLHFTVFGAHVYATGGNDKAATASGISPVRVRFMCFVATSAACGLCGALTGAWLRQGSPATGTGFELQLIAAVIIGGVALAGGAGTIYGTLIGVLIVGMLANGLVLVGAQANWNEFFVGLIVVAVATSEIAIARRNLIVKRLRQMAPRRVPAATRKPTSLNAEGGARERTVDAASVARGPGPSASATASGTGVEAQTQSQR